MNYKVTISVGGYSWTGSLPYEWKGPYTTVDVSLENLTNLAFYENLLKQLILKYPNKETEPENKKAYSIARKTLQQGGEIGIYNIRADGDGGRTQNLYLNCQIFSAQELAGGEEETDRFTKNSKKFKVDITLPRINKIVANEMESQLEN